MHYRTIPLLILALPSFFCTPAWGEDVIAATDSLLKAEVNIPPDCGAMGVLSLDSLFAIAERESRLLQSGSTAHKAAREATRSALSGRLPTISVSANASYTGNATLMSRGYSTHGTVDVIVPGLGPQPVSLGAQPTPHWGNNYAIEVSQVLYAGGAITAGIRMAELGEQLAALDVEKNRQEIRFLLTGYCLELQKLANQMEVIDQNIAVTRQLIADTEKRVERGIVLSNDLTRFELQLQQLLLAHQQLEDAASIIRYQISETLHIAPLPLGFAACNKQELPPIGGGLEALEYDAARHVASTNIPPARGGVGSLEDWLALASQNHVGLQQASVATNIAEQRYKLTRAASLPKVALQLGDAFGGPYTQDLIPTNANTNAWFFGVGIKYDLSSLYRNNHAKRKARLDVIRAQEDAALAREGVSQGVQAAYVNYLTSFTEVQTQEKSVQLAEENYAVVEHRYNNQLCILTDLLEATSAKQSAEIALVNARINLLYNFYKLKYVTNTL